MIRDEEENLEGMRLNKFITRNFINLYNGVTEVEYCDHETDVSILLIPPDPNWGGSMKTPIIEKLFKYFDKSEYSTMRFTFTKYQIFNNNYDKYITQAAICLEELLRVLEYTKKVWVIGYSFGSLVALNLALRRPDISGVIMLSPPILNYDFISWFLAFNTKILTIYGTKDHLIPENIIDAYVRYLSMYKMQVSICPILGSDHYLKGKEEKIAEECLNFIESCEEEQEEDIDVRNDLEENL